MENTDPAKLRPVNPAVGKMIHQAAAAAGCDPARVVELLVESDTDQAIGVLLQHGNFSFNVRKRLLALRDEWAATRIPPARGETLHKVR